MLFVSGFSMSVVNVPINTLMQEVTPDHIRGRVNSIAGTFCIAAMPLGMGFGGALIDWLGVKLVFLLISITVLITGCSFACTKTLRRY